MYDDLVIYKRIERWSNRPGVVAIATLLVKDDYHGIYEVDIKTKGEAVKITLGLIKMYKLWRSYYEKVESEAPKEIRAMLWDSNENLHLGEPGEGGIAFTEWTKKVVDISIKHEELIMCDYPGRNVRNTLRIIKQEIVYFERVLNEFMNL